MRMHPIRPLVVATALVALLAGCGADNDRHSDAVSATTAIDDSPTTSTAVVESTLAATTTTAVTVTTHATHGSGGGSTGTAKTTTTTAAPQAKPAEAMAEAAPNLAPVVVTLVGPLAMSCATLTLAGGKGSISWTTSHATSVSLSVNRSRGISGLAANGSRLVTLQCGTTNIITVTPLNSSGAGDAKQFQVTVGA